MILEYEPKQGAEKRPVFCVDTGGIMVKKEGLP